MSTQNTSFIHFALLGFSRYANSSYLEFLLSDKKVDLKAIYDVPERITEIKKELPEIPLYTDFNKLISSENIDSVIISTPHNLHYEMAHFCLSNDLNVFIDKPLAMTYTEAKELVDLGKIRKKELFVALPRRYSIINRTIEDYLQSGKLGTITNCDFTYYRSRYSDFKTSWRNTEKGGGGVVMDAGYHIIDMLLRFVNSKPVDIQCQLEKHEFEVETVATIMAKFENKILANIKLDLHNIQNLLFENICIHGSKGVILFNRLKSKTKPERKELFFMNEEGILALDCYDRNNIDLLPLKQFITLLEKTSYANNNYLANDLNTIQFINEVYKSAKG